MTRRFLVTLLSAMHAASFHWGYVVFLQPRWAYWGFEIHGLTPSRLFAAYAFAVLPSLFLPTMLRRPSSFLGWIFYIVIYVPSVFAVVLRGDTTYNWVELLTAMACGVLIVAAVRWVPLPATPRRQMSPAAFWSLLVVAYVIFNLGVFRTYGGHLRIVSFRESSVLRFEARQIDTLATGYIVPMLSNVWNPLLMTCGLFRRRYLLFTTGVAGQVFIYMTAAMKSIVLSPLIIVAMFVVIRRRPNTAVTLLLGGCILLTGGITAAVARNAENFDESPQVTDAASLVLTRTFGIPGLNTAIYADFFSDNPRTYWSHVRGISMLVHYPYAIAIPYVIGGRYYGTEELSANAHFWAQDGIAAAGIPGIVVISVVVAAVLWMFDAAGRHLNGQFVMVFASCFAVALTNGAIFTNLLTGGLAVAMLVLRAMPPELTAPEPVQSRLRPRLRQQSRAVRRSVRTA